MPLRGTLVENKGYTISVHYRNVPANAHRRVVEAVLQYVRTSGEPLRTTRGKKVIEVRPNVDWDKGHAVSRVLRAVDHAHRSLIMYIGDDRTDEDAFRILPRSAMTIIVGKKKNTSARFRLRSPTEVAQLLAVISALPYRGRAQRS